MEEKTSIGPTMVSRLPKFGGRSTAGGPLCNGSMHPTIPAPDNKTTSPGIRPNGGICPSSFSLKSKRYDGMISSYPTTQTLLGSEESGNHQLPSLLAEGKTSSPGTPKMRRSGCLMVAGSSPKAIPKQSSKVNPKLIQCPLNGVSKKACTGTGIPARAGSESRLVRPMIGNSSPRSISQDSLPQSSDNHMTLTADNMVRSNSFTHFKQIPSPTNGPMMRSFSFNRAVELAKPLANTQLRPPRSSFLKPPQVSNEKMGLGLNGNFGNSSVPSLPSPSFPSTPATPRALKKPLLPSSMLTKSVISSGGSLGYKLTQPGTTKQRSGFPDRTKENGRCSVASEGGGLLKLVKTTEPNHKAEMDSPVSSDGSAAIKNGEEQGKNSTGQGHVETLEDMSLSSASSLERVDTSEEFLDDLDGEVPDYHKSPSQSLHNGIADGESLDLSDKDESPMQDSQGPLVMSPEKSDAPQTSSLELSPSNSSGGTYMWDEEGLEPLGDEDHNISLDSYDDSNLNSMDILNNLEPPGTADLDDNDLMLDVDLPEDFMHDFDRMSQMERPERGNHLGQRRKQHRWIGPDHFYNDSRAHVNRNFDGLKSSRISSQHIQSEGKQRGCGPMLDELTLEHMTQDCSLLRNNLLRLKALLQLEETASLADVCEQSEDNTTVTQVEALIKEVQMLKEELRNRDKTIVQLTLQCQQLLQQQHQREQMAREEPQARCQCHHQRAPSSLRGTPVEKRIHHYDKATQTYWRPPNHAGVLPTPLLSPWQAQQQALTRTSMPQRRHPSNSTAFHPPSQRAPPPGKPNKNSPHRGPQ